MKLESNAILLKLIKNKHTLIPLPYQLQYFKNDFSLKLESKFSTYQIFLYTNKNCKNITE